MSNQLEGLLAIPNKGNQTETIRVAPVHHTPGRPRRNTAPLPDVLDKAASDRKKVRRVTLKKAALAPTTDTLDASSKQALVKQRKSKLAAKLKASTKPVSVKPRGRRPSTIQSNKVAVVVGDKKIAAKVSKKIDPSVVGSRVANVAAIYAPKDNNSIRFVERVSDWIFHTLGLTN
ncbi:hypothetical protein BSLG_010204 [Batrachochytrium salamandrivorans]|nr:hypothetical protein BASA62_002964 [Batrachochytrium salamandrivorans]KAJ1328472.1 hypothetical protein BSLG_010204 [Batrachochytrium salamandrivorans]